MFDIVKNKMKGHPVPIKKTPAFTRLDRGVSFCTACLCIILSFLMKEEGDKLPCCHYKEKRIMIPYTDWLTMS